MNKTFNVQVYNDAVSVKGSNKRVLVMKQKNSKKRKYTATNVIHLRALVSETGPNAGVKSEISENGKIKYTHIGLSDEAIVELYIALHHYVKKL